MVYPGGAYSPNFVVVLIKLLVPKKLYLGGCVLSDLFNQLMDRLTKYRQGNNQGTIFALMYLPIDNEVILT